MTPIAKSALLDPAAVAAAEALGLQARQIVEGYMSGEHKSPYRGFAIEFAQHREYVPGDDLRHLDYKVLGRTDRYYIKQYEQETNYVAHLLLDGSESMKYGSGRTSKFDYARVMAATLAYLILLQRDAMAVSLFDATVRKQVPRTNSMGSIHNVMATLSQFVPEAKTDVAAVLHEMARQVRRKGIFILISDLFDDPEKIMEGVQHLRFDGHEVLVFHVLDPYELRFPFTGRVEFLGLEGMDPITTQPTEIRKSYLAEFGAFLDRVRQACERNRCHYVQVDTSRPWAEVLSAYLASRQHTGF